MYSLEVREKLNAQFKKLFKKDKVSYLYIQKKITEIQQNPYHFKPLRVPLEGYRRVHIGNFVLIYTIDEKRKAAILEKYEHHDTVYKM